MIPSESIIEYPDLGIPRSFISKPTSFSDVPFFFCSAKYLPFIGLVSGFVTQLKPAAIGELVSLISFP